MHTLVRLIFSSETTGPLNAETMRQIADASERNNWRDGITGVLMACKQRFLQVIEGDRADVSACFARIAADARNSNPQLLSLTYIPRRQFARWSMHQVTPTPDLEQAMDWMLDALEHNPGTQPDAAGELLTRLLKCAGAPTGDPTFNAPAAQAVG